MAEQTLTLDQAYQYAAAAFQAGRMNEAERLCRAILSAKPGDMETTLFLGSVLLRLNRPQDAEHCASTVIAMQPDNPSAHNNRGIALATLKRLKEAVESFDAAIALDPNFISAIYNRATTLTGLGRFEDALAGFDRVIALKPDYAAAHNNRGNALKSLGRPEEAMASFAQAIKLAPTMAEAHFNHALVLADLKRGDEALAGFDKVLALAPQFAQGHASRANALIDLGRAAEALESYDRAIALKPDYVDAYNNRGIAFAELGRLEDSVASYDKALEIAPKDAAARYNRSLRYLTLGRFKEAWPEYEHRWETEEFFAKRPRMDAPAWNGEPLEGKRIVVYGEQGLGDVLQFVRYLPLLAEQGAKVTLLVPENLGRLLRHSFPGIEIAEAYEKDAAFDYTSALMSLPLHFGTDLSNIPARVPYLKAEDALVESWRARLGAGLKIGIAWQGQPNRREDIGRSIPLAAFAPLAKVPGVRLISLQKHHGLDQLKDLPGVETLDGLDEGGDAFVDTAAVMQSLDLAVVSDSSIAHLAGALNRPVWLALKKAAMWHWLRERPDSPWYPSMRLFRQTEAGDWTSVFAEMARELEKAK